MMAEDQEREADRVVIAQAVRRQVGIAALRKLRHLVDEDAAREQLKARWARRLGWTFAATGVVFLLWLVWRSGG